MLLKRACQHYRRYMTASEFAREMGVSSELIKKMIQNGRIKKRKRQGRSVIDYKTEAPKLLAVSPKARKAQAQRREQSPPSGNGSNGGNGGGPTDAANNVIITSLTESREAQERYKALKLKADYEKRVGELIETETVQRDWAAILTMIRKAVVSISDRIAPIVAPETDEHTVHRIIEDECTLILENLSSEIESRSESNPALTGGEGDPSAEEADDY